MEMNRAVMAMQPSGIRRITAEARRIPGCISLTLGEPDFDTPEPIRARTKRALDENYTHYPPNAGYAALRKQIAAYENGRHGTDYTEDEVIVTAGSTEAIACALIAILNPGDEVIVPVPAFGLYEQLIAIAGGVYVPLHTEEDGFQITEKRLDACLTERTKAIIVTTPNNPTGCVLEEPSLSLLSRAAKARGLFVLLDGVYDRLIYRESIPHLMDDTSLKDRLIALQSFSKPFAMTGWRVGYSLADAPVTAQMLKVHASLVVGVSAFSQRGCEGIFDTDIEPMRARYRERRDYVLSRLAAMGLETVRPDGAFYVFPSIARFQMPSEEFALRLMREAKVAVVPGSCFGVEGFVRITYCYSDGELQEGMDRLERFVRTL